MTGGCGGRSSFDDLGDAEKGRLRIGRVAQDVGGDGAADVDVFAESGVGGLVVGEDLGHGRDVGGVELVELADVFEDFVNLGAIGFELRFGEFDIGEVGDAENVFASDFHLECLVQQRNMELEF